MTSEQKTPRKLAYSFQLPVGALFYPRSFGPAPFSHPALTEKRGVDSLADQPALESPPAKTRPAAFPDCVLPRHFDFSNRRLRRYSVPVTMII
jgi:hypothetical protein